MSTHDLQRYVGHYNMMDYPLEVKIVNSLLVTAFPGVPEGYEVILTPTATPHTFQMKGGPMSGASMIFALNESGQGEKIRVGPLELPRCAPANNGSPILLLPPPLSLDHAKQSAFAALWQAIRARADGSEINYQLPYPKHEFLRYLSQLDEVLFHGSNHATIDRFQPIRHSYELSDTTSRGNLQAIYATHDGLWPLFFAVLDRQQLKGSMRNGVMYFQNAASESLAVYQFSLNRQTFDLSPWRQGTLYLLPRATFRRLELAPGILSNEWASEVAVTPLARLAVAPEDFPFLSQVQLHDDGELVRLGEASDGLFATMLSAAETDEGFTLDWDWNETVGQQLLAYLSLQRKYTPTATFILVFPPNGGPVQLQIQGPPAFEQVLRNKLHKLGKI